MITTQATLRLEGQIYGVFINNQRVSETVMPPLELDEEANAPNLVSIESAGEKSLSETVASVISQAEKLERYISMNPPASAQASEDCAKIMDELRARLTKLELRVKGR